jgi:PAS domain S-box-containing protein
VGAETATVDEEGNDAWSVDTRVPWLDGNGEVAGILGMSFDITEKKRVEDQLGLMQFSIEHAGEAVFWLAPDLRFVYVNSAACLMLGYTRDELLVMSLIDIDKRFPVQMWPQIWEKMKQGDAPTFAARHTAKDGRVIPVEVSSNYLGFNGREYSCTFVRDVTRRKQSEDALKRSLAELETIVSAVSESDLTKRAVEDDTTLGRIAQSVNKMLGNFSVMIMQVKGLGLTVSSSASQIMAASEDIALGLQRQAEEIADSSSAIEEMAASLSQVSRNAETTTEAAQRALDMAKRGDIAVNNTLQAMERIDVAVQLTAEKMHTLAQRSSEISEILGMINGIASQTNLLSLNAAIQAAHAGEAGLGFGVVADEIRKLAERSSQSTKDINFLNKAIQQETSAALSSMDLAMKEVKAGSQLAQIAGQSIQDISVVVTQSASLIEEISQAADEQAKVSQSIAGAMQTVSSIASGTSSGTHQTSSIMHGLVNIAENLSQTMLKFKIGDEPTGSPSGRVEAP